MVARIHEAAKYAPLEQLAVSAQCVRAIAVTLSLQMRLRLDCAREHSDRGGAMGQGAPIRCLAAADRSQVRLVRDIAKEVWGSS